MHRCRDCGAIVRTGEAQVRSVMFELVYWCRPCWDARSEGLVVPLPRRSSEDLAPADDPAHDSADDPAYDSAYAAPLEPVAEPEAEPVDAVSEPVAEAVPEPAEDEVHVPLPRRSREGVASDFSLGAPVPHS